MQHLIRIFRAILLRDTWKLIKKCDVLLVRSDEDCGYSFRGRIYSPLIDSIGDMLNNNGLQLSSVAKSYSKVKSADAYSAPVLYNRRDFTTALIGRVATIFYSREKCILWKFNRRTKFWKLLLEKAKPVCVIGIQPDENLCEACNTSGIPVYDLQHGRISIEHPWYSSNRFENTSSLYLPSGYLLWDDISAEILRQSLPQRKIDIRIVGNPWFSRFMANDERDVIVQNELKNGKISKDDKPVILVSLQWGLDRFYNHSEFNGVMVDAIERTILETSKYYNWLIRLHPLHIRGSVGQKAQQYLDKTFDSLESVEWHKCSELPLPVVLNQADLHITDSSSVVTEASWMGVHSALLNSSIRPGGSLESFYANERSVGLAEVIPQDSAMIRRWIANCLAQGKNQIPFEDRGTALNDFINDIIVIADQTR